MLQKIFRYKRIWLVLLAPLGLLLTLMARVDHGWVDGFHAKYVYPLFANSIGWVLSLVPFSVLEILVLLAGAGLLFYIGWSVYKMVRYRNQWKGILLRLLLNLCGGASVLYFGFVLFMGLNYYRAPIADHLELQVQKSSKEELYDLCELLVYDCNFYREKLQEDAHGVALLQDENFYQTAAAARDAYAKLEEEIPALQAADIRNKPLLTSKLFSMVLTTGIYVPFESGINVDAPAHSVPATMCHELTHFRGFMREEEANFLGYLACKKADRADFGYSGSLMAFEYSFSALYTEDTALAQKIAKLCGAGMLRDLQAQDRYWNPYRHTVVGETSQEVYDQYLQSNGQESGIKSYGEMVDLLLAYYRNHKDV